MKALQITEPGAFELRDVATPEPGPGEVLVKIEAVTTCPHWDLHIFRGIPMFAGGHIDYPYPLGQPGHEACGTVAALGEGVDAFAVGDRVCLWRDRGHHVPGCYAEYVAADGASCIKVPGDRPASAWAPLELAMCASAHVLYADRIEPLAEKRVGVFGLGPAGLVFVQLARAAGAKEVYGFDLLEDRRNRALQLGVDEALDPMSYEGGPDFPRRGTEGCLDCAFDCAGYPEAVYQAMDTTRHLVVLFAVQREPYEFRPQYWPGLTLAGTRPHTREAAEYALARIKAGSLNLAPLITHSLGLAEYDKAVELLKRKEALKVALFP